MKTFLTLLVVMAVNCPAQNISHKDIKNYLALCYNDSIYSEYWVTPNCNGSIHNLGDIIGTTLIYCPPYLKKEWRCSVYSANRKIGKYNSRKIVKPRQSNAEVWLTPLLQ